MNATSEKIKVTIIGGGFHGEQCDIVEVDRAHLLSSEDIERIFANPELHPAQAVLISPDLHSKISQSYCGMSDCTCCDHLNADYFDAATSLALFGLEEELAEVRCEPFA